MTYRIETDFVQIGNRSNPETGAVSSPIYLSTAYEHPGLGESTGYDYTRTKNPTRTVLEEGMAKLEKGDAGFACSSGMAAIQLVLSLFKTGDQLLINDDIYGGSYRLFDHYEEAYQIEAIYEDFSNVSAVERCINERCKAIFIESPTNPLMKEIDIEAYAQLAKKYGLLLIVDNTFLTPYFQQPISLGADIVIHSATKYLGGHNDLLAGIVVAKGETLCERLDELHKSSGATLSPFDSWLLIRGLKTLPLRMQQHEKNAQEIVKFLEKEASIRDILYAGKGGMLSFRLRKKEWVDILLRSIKLITFAESLGGVESFMTYPTTQTHAAIPEAEREQRGVCQRLLRLSVGIERSEDLIADLKQAFAQFE